MPGEPEDAYKAGLAAMIKELEAKTLLQVYLVEKIYDCLWWIRRYEDQKRVMVIVEMARQTNVEFQAGKIQVEIDMRESLMINDLNSRVMKALGAIGHTPDSLKELAFRCKRDQLMQLDQQIALQAKILAGFQGSYELAFNRKLNVERLKLQNNLMRRDLAAIEEVRVDQKDDVVDVKAISHDKSPKAQRKSR